MNSGQDTVSVIVPTRNERRNIERCLASVRAQTYPCVEIVVVDNFSEDGTPALAHGIADIVLSAGPERCSQRNLGAKHASGKYLLFIDADMELTPNVVKACVAKGDCGTNPAVIIPEISQGSTFWARCKNFEKEMYRGALLLEAPRFFTRDLFLSIGGYDELLRAFEDWDLRQRIEAITSCMSVDAVIIHHEGRITLASTFRKKRSYATSFAAYSRKHPNAARRQISPSRLGLLGKGVVVSPILFFGTVILKAWEYTGFQLGLRLDARYEVSERDFGAK